MNLLYGTVKVGACLVVHIHHHCARLGSLLYVLLWVDNHEMHVERLGTYL